MKWKYIITLLCLSLAGLAGTIYYYNFSWKEITSLAFYENLANPSIKIVKITPGLRKEEVANIMAQKLGWGETEKNDFINAHIALNTDNQEGHYFPKSYMLNTLTETPVSVSNFMFQTFNTETKNIPKLKSTKILNEETALTIASIIQREAGGKNDMKLISGIIWNRIFAGMKLQMDATLQYVKGNDEDGWWPKVEAKDKYIESPYNTYKYKDLPPSPIANPGLAAIEAAYNPEKTSCFFYIHDKKGKIHCSKTYEGHKKNIEQYY